MKTWQSSAIGFVAIGIIVACFCTSAPLRPNHTPNPFCEKIKKSTAEDCEKEYYDYFWRAGQVDESDHDKHKSSLVCDNISQHTHDTCEAEYGGWAMTRSDRKCGYTDDDCSGKY